MNNQGHEPGPSNSWGLIVGALLGHGMVRARAWLHEVGMRFLAVLLVAAWALRRGSESMMSTMLQWFYVVPAFAALVVFLVLRRDAAGQYQRAQLEKWRLEREKQERKAAGNGKA